MVDVSKKVGVLEKMIEIYQLDNERKLELEQSILSCKEIYKKIDSYEKEVNDMIDFFTDLDVSVIKQNTLFLEGEIDEALAKAFPIDNFKSLIKLDTDNKGLYTAVLKIGKNGEDFESIVFQNGDFLQQLVQFKVYESLLAIKSSKILLIDEGFNNGDEGKYILIANFLEELNIPFKVMIEHQSPIVQALAKKNVVRMVRDAYTNTVSLRVQ
jgi:hypothetical protein